MFFSTASDNQPAVTIHVLQGERERASANISLGQFNLEEIDPAPRGVPQIEVSFDIDQNGIVKVGAKDKKTGRENKIVIQSPSGLSKEEVEQKIREAAEYEKEDKEYCAKVKAKNDLEQAINLGAKAAAAAPEGPEKTALEELIARATEEMAELETGDLIARATEIATAAAKIAPPPEAEQAA